MLMTDRKLVEVLGVKVDRITMQDARVILDGFLHERRNRLIVTANAEMVMMAQQDDELFQIMNTADLVLPDGVGVVWASGRLGNRVPERVAGYDLTQVLLQDAAAAGWKVFWLGAAPGIAEAAAKQAELKFPGLLTVGTHDGYFPEGCEEIVESIRCAQPDLLLCALGVPRQEKWLSKNLDRLQVPVSIGVGGTFDVMAGKVKRAPLWWQKSGLEWAYRLIQQPGRLRRMLVLPVFAAQVIRASWTTRC